MTLWEIVETKNDLYFQLIFSCPSTMLNAHTVARMIYIF